MRTILLPDCVAGDVLLKSVAWSCWVHLWYLHINDCYGITSLSALSNVLPQEILNINGCHGVTALSPIERCFLGWWRRSRRPRRQQSNRTDAQCHYQGQCHSRSSSHKCSSSWGRKHMRMRGSRRWSNSTLMYVILRYSLFSPLLIIRGHGAILWKLDVERPNLMVITAQEKVRIICQVEMVRPD